MEAQHPGELFLADQWTDQRVGLGRTAQFDRVGQVGDTFEDSLADVAVGEDSGIRVDAALAGVDEDSIAAIRMAVSRSASS